MMKNAKYQEHDKGGGSIMKKTKKRRVETLDS